jgi:hypothetical protein
VCEHTLPVKKPGDVHHVYLFAVNFSSLLGPDQPIHRVYCTFFARKGWQVAVLRAGPPDAPPQDANLQGPEEANGLPSWAALCVGRLRHSG